MILLLEGSSLVLAVLEEGLCLPSSSMSMFCSSFPKIFQSYEQEGGREHFRGDALTPRSCCAEIAALWSERLDAGPLRTSESKSFGALEVKAQTPRIASVCQHRAAACPVPSMIHCPWEALLNEDTSPRCPALTAA